MTDKEKIDYFTKQVDIFLCYFGLYDYRVGVGKNDETVKGVSATTFWHGIDSDAADSQVIDILYNEDWIKKKELSKKEIQQTAFHEVLEIVLHKLSDYAKERKFYISDREIDTEKHRIIRIFENTVLRDIV